MSTLPPDGDPGECFDRPFSDLRDTGLLWLINRTVLHPRGYALALNYEEPMDGDEPTGWSLMGDGSEPWQYGCDPGSQAREHECFIAVQALLNNSWALDCLTRGVMYE